ncbi:MAG TPA: hypothetical protein PKC59_01915 [Burkholderiaceae bacterium]|nr:hypothetical protein [Burkholderiaceae bacterium]
MKIEIIDFILPGFDAIQIIFGTIIYGLLITTILFVRRSATAANWGHNWQGRTSNDTSDDIDAQHGSVTDLSHAVATKAEQLAEVMPGILLIIGLLGTFLGLGMALNNASSILSNANQGGDMEHAMGDLMGMMQGLGTKFKTSTWGIMAFLMLKGWCAYDGFDERRLRWCIKRMKTEIDASKRITQETSEATNRKFLSALSSVGDQLYSGTQNLHTMLHAQLTAVHSSIKHQLEKSDEITRNGRAIHKSIESFAANTNTVDAITMLSEKVCSSTRSMQTALQTQLTYIHAGVKQQVQLSDSIASSGSATRQSIQAFTEASLSNINILREASTKTLDASQKMGDSAGELQSVIQSFRDNITEVLSILKQDLGSTIENMNTNFGKNMDQIATKLSEATTGISVAVDDLSQNVGETMGQVEKSITESVDIQKKAHGEFLLTSETLNTQVTEMTNLVLKLSDDITSGLKAVSESGRRMVNLDKRYQDVTQSTEQLVKSSEETIKQISELVSIHHKSTNESVRHIADTSVEIRSDAAHAAKSLGELGSHLKNASLISLQATDDRKLIISKLGHIDTQLADLMSHFQSTGNASLGHLN